MKLNRILCAIMSILIMVAVAACSKNDISSAYPNKKVGFQLENPADGDQIAVMHTNMGDIKLRFFPEAAPKAVENFITHSRNGYYDGIKFHRVMNGFMIQGGDPEGTGGGGESIWGKDFEDEFDPKLVNVRGSLAMANQGKYDKATNGSQFFINQAGPEAFAGKEKYQTNAENYLNDYEQQKNEAMQAYNQYKDQIDSQFGSFDVFFKSQYYLAPDPKLVSDEVWEFYEKHGGNIALDGAWREWGGHTVFGQVFEGMDIVDKIAAVETDSENNKPLEDVLIESIDIMEYKG